MSGNARANSKKYLQVSDSSDDEVDVGVEQYKQAEISQGLSSKRNRLRAVQELCLIVERLYVAYCSKQAQLAIFEDLISALQILDRRKNYSEELSKLVKAAHKVLPQQKRNQINKEYKTTALARRRSSRKEGKNGSGSNVLADEDDDADDLVFGHLPSEVVHTIFCHLDPLSLASATCVSRAWMSMSHACESWRCWAQAYGWLSQRGPTSTAADNMLTRTTGAADGMSVNVDVKQWHSRFSAIVQERPFLLLPWQSDRVLLNGRLSWHGMPRPLEWLRLHNPARSRRHRICQGPMPMTVTQVVDWLLGQEIFDSSSDGASSSESSDDEDDVSRPLRLWNLRT